MKKYFFLAVVLISLIGCFQINDFGREGGDPDPVMLGRPLIFQSEYTNYAWGYNHNGWMMDGTGLVKRFQKTTPWVFPDSLGYISEIDMQKNLNACDSLLEHIAPYELSKYSLKALNCVDGPMTNPKNTMADAGEHIWAFYIYDYKSARKRYKRVILNMTGDWSQENLAANAKEVVDWMMKIK